MNDIEKNTKIELLEELINECVEVNLNLARIRVVNINMLRHKLNKIKNE